MKVHRSCELNGRGLTADEIAREIKSSIDTASNLPAASLWSRFLDFGMSYQKVFEGESLAFD
jgi:orotate phosphoribosyltransferase-like protein